MKGQTQCDQCGYEIPRVNPITKPTIQIDFPNTKAVRNLAAISTQDKFPHVYRTQVAPAESDTQSVACKSESTVTGGISKSKAIEQAKSWIKEANKNDADDFEDWIGNPHTRHGGKHLTHNSNTNKFSTKSSK